LQPNECPKVLRGFIGLYVSRQEAQPAVAKLGGYGLARCPRTAISANFAAGTSELISATLIPLFGLLILALDC
jgi:hypothetical protein